MMLRKAVCCCSETVKERRVSARCCNGMSSSLLVCSHWKVVLVDGVVGGVDDCEGGVRGRVLRGEGGVIQLGVAGSEEKACLICHGVTSLGGSLMSPADHLVRCFALVVEVLASADVEEGTAAGKVWDLWRSCDDAGNRRGAITGVEGVSASSIFALKLVKKTADTHCQSCILRSDMTPVVCVYIPAEVLKPGIFSPTSSSEILVHAWRKS